MFPVIINVYKNEDHTCECGECLNKLAFVVAFEDGSTGTYGSSCVKNVMGHVVTEASARREACSFNFSLTESGKRILRLRIEWDDLDSNIVSLENSQIIIDFNNEVKANSGLIAAACAKGDIKALEAICSTEISRKHHELAEEIKVLKSKKYEIQDLLMDSPKPNGF